RYAKKPNKWALWLR
ncbi:aminotransferase class-V family protein, partial [Vibrio parahaemolyticus V-223/04]